VGGKLSAVLQRCVHRWEREGCRGTCNSEAAQQTIATLQKLVFRTHASPAFVGSTIKLLCCAARRDYGYNFRRKNKMWDLLLLFG
jgi:hypothetical protein